MPLILFPIAYFVGIIAAAHYVAPAGYHWMDNTVSELAVQDHKHRWVMQAGFVGFGFLLNVGFLAIISVKSSVNFPDIALMVYGFSVLLSGFFCAAPINPAIRFSQNEARIHSFFATLAGISFSLGILGHLMLDPTPGQKTLHLVFLLLVVGLSIGFGLAESEKIPVRKGVIQRLLYLTSLVWLAVAHL